MFLSLSPPLYGTMHTGKSENDNDDCVVMTAGVVVTIMSAMIVAIVKMMMDEEEAKYENDFGNDGGKHRKTACERLMN